MSDKITAQATREGAGAPPQPTVAEKDSKIAAVHLENTVSRHESLLIEAEKNALQIGKVDYSGAYEKTDPREIALVKKLDLWIMVRCCLCILFIKLKSIF